MTDVRKMVDSMAAGTARAACKLHAQRPGVNLYLYYLPAVDGEWGCLTLGWDDDDVQAPNELATGEPIPFAADSVSIAHWIRNRAGLYKLPICGD